MKTLLATVAVAAMVASSALAQTATQRVRPQQAPAQAEQSFRNGTSIDGRVEGQPRTCDQQTFQYDAEGTPIGPYCH